MSNDNVISDLIFARDRYRAELKEARAEVERLRKWGLVMEQALFFAMEEQTIDPEQTVKEVERLTRWAAEHLGMPNIERPKVG